MQFSSWLRDTKTSRIVYSLIRIAVGCWLGFLLAGCATSVRNDPQYQLFKEQFVSTRLRTQQDLFLVEYPVTHTISLEAPGWGSSVPLSVEDYEINSNPSYWAHTKQYLDCYGPNRTNQQNILGVINKETTIIVTKIQRRNKPLIGTCYSAWGRVEDPQYTRYEVWLTFVFDGGAFDRPLVPNPDCLREI